MNLGLDTLITSSAPFLIVLQIWRPRVLGWHWLALYPSGFTQLSNDTRMSCSRARLCTPLDLHSSQTTHHGGQGWEPLCTPLDLHSSQTGQRYERFRELLCTPLDLHSSQTATAREKSRSLLCTPLDLHSSQTASISNLNWFRLCTPLDLHSSQTAACSRSGTCCFVPLWIYTALKPGLSLAGGQAMLCTPLDLHSSQTSSIRGIAPLELCTPLDLHSSQTRRRKRTTTRGFVPLWIYTALKRLYFMIGFSIMLCTPLDLHSSQT